MREENEWTEELILGESSRWRLDSGVTALYTVLHENTGSGVKAEAVTIRNQ